MWSRLPSRTLQSIWRKKSFNSVWRKYLQARKRRYTFCNFRKLLRAALAKKFLQKSSYLGDTSRTDWINNMTQRNSVWNPLNHWPNKVKLIAFVKESWKCQSHLSLVSLVKIPPLCTVKANRNNVNSYVAQYPSAAVSLKAPLRFGEKWNKHWLRVGLTRISILQTDDDTLMIHTQSNYLKHRFS